MINLQEAISTTKKYTLPIGDIKILDRHTFRVRQMDLPVSKTAFKDLLKIVNLTDRTIDTLNMELQYGAGFALIKELMKAMAARKGVNVNLYIDETNKKVVRISDSGVGDAVPMDMIQNLLEYAMDVNQDLSMRNSYITDGGTKVVLDLMHSNNITLMIKGENISLGKQIVWDLLGPTSVHDLVERLVCQNGMTAIEPKRKAKFLSGESKVDEWYQMLFKDLIDPNKELVEHYQTRLLQARQTNLSVYEFNQVKSQLMDTWYADHDVIIKYLGNDEWKNSYSRKGIELEKLTAGQLKNCPTSVNAWDAINCMTDLCSHKYKTEVSPGSMVNTQRMAGKLLNKQWDMDQQMYDVPTFKVDGPQVAINYN
jgi:hypothetical protein